MICNAKNRSGTDCKKSAIKGKTKCANHGGKSIGAPKGNSYTVTHGIFSNKLTPDESQDYSSLELGSVDHELRLMRIRLGRALDAEKRAASRPEILEVTETHGLTSIKSRRSVVKDYYGIVDRLIGRIESLEKTRMVLNVSGSSNNGNEVMGFEVVEYVLSPDEPAPKNPIL